MARNPFLTEKVTLNKALEEVVVVHSLSHVWLFATPRTAAYQASLSFTISRSLLKLVFIESVMPSNHLIFCHLLLLLHSVFPSIRVFSSEWAFCIRWPKDWSFSFSLSPSNEYSRLTSCRIDWFDLLTVQGTLKSLLQYHNSESINFFRPQLFLWSSSHTNMNKPYSREGEKQKNRSPGTGTCLTHCQNSKKASITGGKEQKWSRGGDFGQRDGKPELMRKSCGLV